MKEDKEFKQKKELLELKREINLEKHKLKMEEIEEQKKNLIMVHTQILEREDIKRRTGKSFYQP